jgi:hypothetical protein
MRRMLVLLFALVSLPTVCLAGSIDNVTNYQINITATWIETNPACVSNCTETMNLSYEFESNLDVLNPNSPTYGIYGWVPMDTLQESSSGFMGSFSFQRFSAIPASGLWEDDGLPSADGIPFNNAFSASGYRDEIDLGIMGPGLSGRGGPHMFISDCFTESCQNAYPGVTPEDIMDNRETFTAVKVPAGDSAWELLFVSTIICTFGLFVKYRLGLTPSR